MGGNEGAHGKMGGGGGVRVRVWHVSTAMCCFPAYSHQTLLLSLPHFRTDHCSKEPKTMKQENTHPILKF